MSTRPDLAVVFPRAGVTGGVERVVLDLVKFESARRETFFVGQLLEADDLRQEQVSVRHVPQSLRPLAFRRDARRALRRLQPATVVTFGVNCPPGDVYWVQSVHRAWLEDGGEVRYRGIRVPARVRELLLRHQVLLRLEHNYFVNHRPRVILCTSQREIDDLARLYAVPREIMHVVPNSFDGGVFNVERRQRERSEMRAAIEADDEDIVVLLIANEWHRKGLGALLEAVASRSDRRLRIDLVGVRAPSDYLPMAARLGLADRIHWHGPSTDVARFHAAADIFALPTTYEPFGTVIIEAMASGLPVIASRLAGASAAINHGVNGLLLDDPRDSAELGDAITRLAEPSERERMAAMAAATVGDYEWRQVFARADELIFCGG